jgi:hypothetical protein
LITDLPIAENEKFTISNNLQNLIGLCRPGKPGHTSMREFFKLVKIAEWENFAAIPIADKMPITDTEKLICELAAVITAKMQNENSADLLKIFQSHSQITQDDLKGFGEKDYAMGEANLVTLINDLRNLEGYVAGRNFFGEAIQGVLSIIQYLGGIVNGSCSEKKTIDFYEFTKIWDVAKISGKKLNTRHYEGHGLEDDSKSAARRSLLTLKKLLEFKMQRTPFKQSAQELFEACTPEIPGDHSANLLRELTKRDFTNLVYDLTPFSQSYDCMAEINELKTNLSLLFLCLKISGNDGLNASDFQKIFFSSHDEIFTANPTPSHPGPQKLSENESYELMKTFILTLKANGLTLEGVMQASCGNIFGGKFDSKIFLDYLVKGNILGSQREALGLVEGFSVGGEGGGIDLEKFVAFYKKVELGGAEVENDIGVEG